VSWKMNGFMVSTSSDGFEIRADIRGATSVRIYPWCPSGWAVEIRARGEMMEHWWFAEESDARGLADAIAAWMEGVK